MVDSGATNTHVSSDLGRRLGLRGVLNPFVVGSHGGRVEEYEALDCTLQLGAVDGSYLRLVRAKCYSNPCGRLEAPDWKQLQRQWKHLEFVPLPEAAPNKRIELILGTDCLDAIEAIVPVVFGAEGEPCAKLTKLGWVLGGRTTPTVLTRVQEEGRVVVEELPPPLLDEARDPSRGREFCGFMRELGPDSLEREWAIETPECEERLANSYSPKMYTPQEQRAVKLFKQGLTLAKGRYRVPLMWKGQERPKDNFGEALHIFLRQEVRMRSEPELEIKFKEAVAKWLTNDWAELVPLSDTKGFYIPTFMVVRVDKATTKYRLIMNGAYEFNGKSLNDFLMPGPSRMNKVWDVLARSRRGLYVLACDIESMFLNIRVDEAGGDPKYLRVLFRDPGSGKVRALQCTTHVFGLTQSPYVAMEVVRHHASRHRAEFPYAYQAVMADIIMDDVIHSTNSSAKLVKTQSEITSLFEKASMNVHKWVTNLPELWAQLPEEGRAESYRLADEDDQLFCKGTEGEGPSVKTLGILYHSTTDKFQFFPPRTPKIWTMRSVASYVMQLFDPLELLSPVTQKGRRLTQLLWRLKCKWDEPLPGELARAAEAYARMLKHLHEIHVTRCIRSPLDVSGWEIICFVDASSHTMAGCLYQRTLYVGGTITSALVCSKMKMVPVKRQESIPRVETQAGVIGVRLAFDLATAYRIDMRRITFFSDSTTLLWWLRTTKPMTIFVANRICQILDRTKLSQWHHVRTNENPAEIPTRGSTPAALKTSTLWWEGPPFLRSARSEWPTQPEIFPTAEAEAEELSVREIISNLTFTTVEDSAPRFDPNSERLAALVGCYGSLRKGIRIAAMVWGFLGHRILKESLDLAHRGKIIEMKLICYDQSQTFPDLVECLGKTGRVPHALAHLRPFKGPSGEIRSHTRLQNMEHLDPETKQPILLGKKSRMGVELLRDIHRIDLRHCGGVNTLLAEIGKRFCFLGG